MPDFNALINQAYKRLQDSSGMGYRDMADRFADPNYGYDYFQRMAASLAPAQSDYYGMAQARGGSFAQAGAAYDAARQRAASAGYDAFERFRLGADQNAAGIYGNLAQMQFQDQQRRRQNRTGLLNNILGLGAYAAGTALGGPVGGAAVGGIVGGTPVSSSNPQWDWTMPQGGAGATGSNPWSYYEGY